MNKTWNIEIKLRAILKTREFLTRPRMPGGSPEDWVASGDAFIAYTLMQMVLGLDSDYLRYLVEVRPKVQATEKL